MRKILTVVGARPHFVKAAMVSRAIAATPGLSEVLVHTGQHYDDSLSDVFFRELDLPRPIYNLGVGSQRPAVQTAQIIIGLDEVIDREQPDLIIVYGDTNSTAAGAIAAAQNRIALAHIEAGLREFDKRIPEEVNKLLTDAVADLYFCPTQTGVDNLRRAGITKGVHLVGDVGIDLISANYERIRADTNVLATFGLEPRNYYLLTCHRAANTDDPNRLHHIVAAVAALDAPVIWPLHPRTRKAMDRINLWAMIPKDRVLIIPPLGFWELQTILYYARMAITDSGGIIKESYFHRVPAVIIDDQTEWVETVVEGWNQVVGADTQRIWTAIANFRQPTLHTNCLGDGTAAQQTVAIIGEYLDSVCRPIP